MDHRVFCKHCGSRVNGVAWVHSTGDVTHHVCSVPYAKALRGLVYKCPACADGTIPDMNRPETEHVSVPDPNAWGSGTGFTTEARTTYPHRKKCDACDGEGYTADRLIPVTQTVQVGWCKVDS